MNPVRIDGATHAMGKPQNWDDEEAGRCSTLWTRAEVDRGVQFMRSAWETSADETLCQLAGAKVLLGISGKSHPVVNLGLGPLPKDFLPPLIVEQTVHHGVRAAKVSMLFPVGQRVFATAEIMGDGLSGAVARAIDNIEQLAREHGWL